MVTVTGFDEHLDVAAAMDTGHYQECTPDGAGVIVYLDPDPRHQDVLVCVRESWADDGRVLVLDPVRALNLALGLASGALRSRIDDGGHSRKAAVELLYAIEALSPADPCDGHLYDDACEACP